MARADNKQKCQEITANTLAPSNLSIALNLLYSYRAAYRAITTSGFLSLPSEHTLRDWCEVQNGVHFDFIKQAQKTLQQEGVDTRDSE